MTKHHYVISWGWESVGYNNILDLCWVSTVVRTCSDSFWEQWHHVYTLSEEMDRTLKLSISRKHMVAIWDVIHKPHKPLSDTSRPPIFFPADMCYWGPRTARQQLTSTNKADSDSPCCWRRSRVCVFCVCFLWKPSTVCPRSNEWKLHLSVMDRPLWEQRWTCSLIPETPPIHVVSPWYCCCTTYYSEETAVGQFFFEPLFLFLRTWWAHSDW